jgi:hypothetical protein
LPQLPILLITNKNKQRASPSLRQLCLSAKVLAVFDSSTLNMAQDGSMEQIILEASGLEVVSVK